MNTCAALHPSQLVHIHNSLNNVNVRNVLILGQSISAKYCQVWKGRVTGPALEQLGRAFSTAMTISMVKRIKVAFGLADKRGKRIR